jgi:acetyl esterase/lipase
VLAGDSAGANLALALLLTARDSKLRLPCLTVLLSPATDFRAGLPEHDTHDWIDAAMLSRWADWFCRPEQRCQPLVSPACAELQGLPPMYIQAGGSELLYPSIATFVERATAHGVDITLDTWPEMNHDFQLFGPGVPQAAEALQRIGEAIDCRLPDCKPASLVSPAWCG